MTDNVDNIPWEQLHPGEQAEYITRAEYLVARGHVEADTEELAKRLYEKSL